MLTLLALAAGFVLGYIVGAHKVAALEAEIVNLISKIKPHGK